MSDEARNRHRIPSLLAASLAAGAVSALLYLSVIASFAFLLPVQVAFGRRGRKAGMAAAAAAVLATFLGHELEGHPSGALAGPGGLGGLDLLSLVLPPAVLLSALCLMNASFWEGRPKVLAGLAAVALCSLAAVPAIVAVGSDTGYRAYLEERLGSLFAPLLAQAGEGYEASALRASLEPKALVEQSLAVVRSTFAAFLYALLGASRWLGNRLSGPGTPGREASGPLAEYRLPYALVWPFLAAWTGVLAARYLAAPPALQALSWNLALVFSLAYAVQGIGIASHLMKRWNLPRSLRIALAATALLVVATPPAGTAAAAILPLLGVTEVWIPYRNLKGVGA